MWNVIMQNGVANTGLDFTSDFSALGIGFFGLIALSAVMIVWIAVRQHLVRNAETGAGVEFAPQEYQKAA